MKLRLRLRRERGALERMLLVASRRGFEPLSLNAATGRHHIEVEMVVRGEREVGVLERMLARLHDVLEVEAGEGGEEGSAVRVVVAGGDGD